jgi:hypothetical protein
MKHRIGIIIGVVLSLGILTATAGCDNSTSKVEPLTFPPVTAIDVPEPAPIPWPNITAYTEETYKIDAKVDEEFAIGMFATTSQQFLKSYDQNYVNLISDQMVQYQPSTLNMYGTEWFLFKAIKKGNTEIVFQYPLEFTKIFKVTIN